MVEVEKTCIDCFYSCLGIDRVYCSWLKEEVQSERALDCEHFASILDQEMV